MKKALCLILILSLLLLSITSCSDKIERKYAKELNKAIDAENFDEVNRIISECPEAVNTYPTLAPMWWQGEILMTTIYYPLSEACKTGNLEMVKLLVENGADVNSLTPGWEVVTPLHTTLLYCEGDWYDIVMYLIENEASIDYIDEAYLGKNAMLMDIIMASSRISEEETGSLNNLFVYAVENCDKTNVDWQRVLCWAAGYNNCYDIVKILIEEGYSDVNQPYSSANMTPLMFAIRSSDARMVKYLLQKGADVRAIDEDGKRVLDYAAECEDEEIKSLFDNLI